MREVPYVRLPTQYAEERERLQTRLDAVMASGLWVGGPEVEAFEAAIADYCKVPHAIALSSGTDALILALRAMDVGPGDEVILPPNSFIASASAVVQVGARPVFVDVQEDQNIDPDRIEAAITPKTRAIMPVHLTGRVADMDPVLDIAERHGLRVVEDAAQAVGSRYRGRFAGTLGDIGCFSTHPLKNLNAMGDSGFALTADDDLAARIRRLRNNGLEGRDSVVEWGTVARMDTLQAAVLLERLAGLDAVIEKRRANATRYRETLKAAPVFLPSCRAHEFNTFHTFVIQVERRDALRAHLTENGIGSAIHYPIPIHLQPAARDLGHGPGDFPVAERQAGRILSLPINQFNTADDLDYVADTINGFYT